MSESFGSNKIQQYNGYLFPLVLWVPVENIIAKRGSLLTRSEKLIF
jgi:hypothetical protein